jgi:hypothetical protein
MNWLLGKGNQTTPKKGKKEKKKATNTLISNNHHIIYIKGPRLRDAFPCLHAFLCG